jgi:hypothetical protein
VASIRLCTDDEPVSDNPAHISAPRIGDDACQVLVASCRLARRIRAPMIGSDHVLYALLWRAPILLRTEFPPARRSRLPWRWVRREFESMPRADDRTDRDSDGTDHDRGGAVRGGYPIDPIAADAAVANLERNGALRQAAYETRFFGALGSRASTAPRWHPEVCAAVDAALAAASVDGVPRVGMKHLLDGLLMDSSTRAAKYVHNMGGRTHGLRGLATKAWRDPAGDFTVTVKELANVGAIVPPPGLTSNAAIRWVNRLATPIARMKPFEFQVHVGSVMQAVRLGHPQATTAHQVLAVLTLDDDLASAGAGLPPAEARARDIRAAVANLTLSAALADMVGTIEKEQPASRRRAGRLRRSRHSLPRSIGNASADDAAHHTRCPPPARR